MRGIISPKEWPCSGSDDSGRVVGNSYLGITSGLPVIRPESGPDEPESKLKIDSWESWTLRRASNGQTGQ